jgi:hypothetical protein
LKITPAEAQTNWTTGINNEEQLNSPTTGAVVGTTIGLPPAALTVYGQDMSTATGDVFLTDGPSGQDQNWRLLSGGAPRGRIYNVTGTNELRFDAPAGDQVFFTQSIERMRLTGTLTGQTNNGYTGLDLSGHTIQNIKTLGWVIRL